MSVRSRVLCLAGVLALLGGCTPPPLPIVPTGSPSVPSRSPGALPTQAEVDAALLDAEEIPNGPFQEPAQPLLDSPMLISALNQCADSPDSADPAVVSTVNYQGPTMLSPFVGEVITVTSESAVLQLFSDLDDVEANCGEFGGSMEGFGLDVNITITSLPIPEVGDGTKAFRMTGSVPGLGSFVHAHVATARTGNVLVQILVLELSGPPVIEETRDLLQRAVDKAIPLRSV